MIQQIKYFKAIVETNSFTEAAELCHISQSAISQQIKALETELGTKLLERKGRKFVITEAGTYFYDQSLKLLSDLDSIIDHTKAIGHKCETSVLRIGYLNDYSENELFMAINTFSELHPDINIQIYPSTHEELYELLKNKQIDIVLNDQRRVFSDLYENRVLKQIPYCVEISQRNDLSKQSVINETDLKDIPCILVCSKEQEENERQYYQTYVGINSPFTYVRTQEEAHMLMVQNKGYRLVVKNNPHFGTVLIPFVHHEKKVYRRYCLFWKLDHADSIIEEFGDILMSYYI